MNKFLIKNTFKKIKEFSLANSKEEICGLIYKKNEKYEIYPCENIAINKRTNFVIKPIDVKICEKKGEIIACYHSHIKNGGFSHDDISSSLEIKLPYIVYNIVENKFYFFDPIKYSHYKKYINLEYKNGINDCWATLGRYFNNELKIAIIDPECERFKKPDENLSWTYEDRKEWMDKLNLKRIDPKYIRDLEVNDILVLKSQNEEIPTSGAILLENKLILHQREHQISKIESLRKAHFKMICYVGRINNKK